MKRVAVLQSNYLPWKGYFDIIHDVDLFVFYDEVQFTKNDWRNRNKIIINGQPTWMSIPVGDKIHQRIMDVTIRDSLWQKKHFRTLQMSYRRARYYTKYIDFFYNVFCEQVWYNLSDLNKYLIIEISRNFLGIDTMFADSTAYHSAGVKSEKLLSLLREIGTDIYVSGPAAKDYIDETEFSRSGIKIVWKDYSGYPPYFQQSKEFTHYVSVVDLLFHQGDDAPYYIWGWRNE